MRIGLCIVVGCLFLTGCATKHLSATTADRPVDLWDAPTRPLEQDAAALSLAFDPPVIADQPQLALDREPREPAAFVGYDQPLTTYSYLREDDRIVGDQNGNFERRAITERFGFSTR